MQNILRFYYSCGHVKDTIITEERKNELCKELLVKTIFGDYHRKNSITTEENNKVINIYPFIYCRCNICLNEAIKEFAIQSNLWQKE